MKKTKKKDANKIIHKGDLTAEPGVVYDYTEVTGYIDAIGADTRTAFPALTSVGGSINARGDWASIKTNDTEAESRCRALLMAAFAAAGFSFADGVLAKIISQKGPVSRVIIVGKTQISYLVTDGDAWSHGDTLRKARDGLLYKIGSRDTSEFKGWALDRKVTKREAIRAYRTITGACEPGVKNWMSTHEIAGSLTIAKVIELTHGSYGSEIFATFFKENGPK